MIKSKSKKINIKYNSGNKTRKKTDIEKTWRKYKEYRDYIGQNQ